MPYAPRSSEPEHPCSQPGAGGRGRPEGLIQLQIVGGEYSAAAMTGGLLLSTSFHIFADRK